MQLEKLSRGTFDQHNQDFSECEGLWEPIETELLKRLVESNQETLEMTRPGEDLSFLDWDNVEQKLQNGRVIELIMLFVRERTTLGKCPLCGSNIPAGTESLSRRDNQTLICSVCGQNEALDEFYGQRS